MLAQIIRQIVQMWNSILANPDLCFGYWFIILLLMFPLSVVTMIVTGIFGAISGKYIDPVDVGKAIINAVVIAIALIYVPVFASSVQEATRELGSVAGWVVVIIIHIIVTPIPILNCTLFNPNCKEDREKLFNTLRKLRKH